MKAPAAKKPKPVDPIDTIPAPYLQMAAAQMMRLGKNVFEFQDPTQTQSPTIGRSPQGQ